tara:strand:+ start:2917 stop:3501 length:585 start_codon:yes stop_codon:yes gene_type:complete
MRNLIGNNNKAIVNKFAFNINVVVYNITTLMSIIAILVLNTNKINNNTLKIGKMYLNKMCMSKTKKSMKGGTVLPSSYFGGDDSELYNAPEGTNVQNIQWDKGLIRDILPTSMQNGGCNNNCSFNKKLLMLVGKILKEHKMKIDKSTKQELVNIIKLNLYSIVELLKSKSKKNLLTLKSMKNILSKSKMKKLLI